MPAAFASLLADAFALLLFDLTGIAELACLIGILCLVVCCGAKVSAKILNRGVGK